MEGCRSVKVLFACLLTICFVSNVDLEVPRPRGVPIEKASLYASGVDFSCFDGSAVIPFSQVNDDYCDCPDGSDEPGTSACSNAVFHCINAGHKPLSIPSSRVDDGICDCCDGSDEYRETSKCGNTCMELGREAREEAERKAKLAAEGHQTYLEYSRQGKEAKQENQVRLEELMSQKETLQAARDEAEAAKNEAEAPEKEAKEKHQKAYEEEKAKKDAEKAEAEIQAAFNDLDDNDDDLLTILEMQLREEFDIDANGEVSEEEAREHLEDNESVDLDTFREKVWPNIKAIYQSPAGKDAGGEPVQEAPQEGQEDAAAPADAGEAEALPEEEEDVVAAAQKDYEHEEDYGEEDDEIDDLEDDDFHDDHHPHHHRDEKGDDGLDGMPPFDAETQALVDAAEKARESFRESDNKLEDLKREERELQNMLNMDFGPNMQYYPLKGTCHDLRDREYIYKFCPFERTTQRKAFGGGPETSLGVWGRWEQNEEQPYYAQWYEKGQGCWNGPDRSVRVLIECGVKNELVSTSEPNRCEYQFEFHTPAACSEDKLILVANPHEEL